jgi:hypothetical protein
MVRRRLYSAVPGLIAFVVLGLIATDVDLTRPWLSVGIGMALSATVVEPYFAGPRAAVINGAAGVIALIESPSEPVVTMWWILLAAVAAVAIAGLIATVTSDGALNQIAKAFASQFGRATVIGTSVLFLMVLNDAASGLDRFELLLVATLVLTGSLAIDWSRLLSSVTNAPQTAAAIAAVGPRMLLVAGAPATFEAGSDLTVRTDAGETTGTVVARMPHADGLRHQLALDKEWTQICPVFPCDVSLAPRPGQTEMVGAVGAGTTQQTLEFEPVRALRIGAPVSVAAGSGQVLYQVARLRLDSATWSGAKAVIPHATARLVGWPEQDRVRGGAHLPSPHDLVRTADGLTGGLPDNYHEIGHIKETAIRIGLNLDRGRQGHLAVLGMSGMGKTVAAKRICEALGMTHVVIAVDTTGEYASRLGFSRWTPGDFGTVGHWVYEPAGPPPTQAANFIEQCMTAGSDEYRAGQTPTPRVVLLEEAHSFIPEFPLALRDHQAPIGKSTRFIMQSRKFGITFVIVSQRTAVVSKSALSQCENYIILKTLDKTSLEYLESLVGSEIRDAIPGLGRYDAACVGPAFNADEPVIVTLSAP